MPNAWGIRYGDVDEMFTDGSGIYMRSVPDLPDYDITDEDEDLARADGAGFGEDFHGGRTIGIEFGITGRTEAEMWDRFGRLSQLWDAAAVRAKPGAYAELVTERGRSAFGRPRKIAPENVSPEARMMTVQTTFRQKDPNYYGPEESVTVPLAQTQGGGFVFGQHGADTGTALVEDPPGSGLYSPGSLVETPPGSGLYSPGDLVESPPGSGLYLPDAAQPVSDGLRFPLVARGYSTRLNTFNVVGDKPAAFVAEIRGAVLNPRIEVPGLFTYAAPTSLAYDEWITIDTRPGQMSVLRNGSKIASLTLTSSLLTDGLLTPGQHALILSGSSSTGNPEASITWRPVYPSP